MNAIPQFVTNFRVYNSGNALLGVTGDVTMPNFEAMTEAISGAGILGEFEASIPGSFKSQNLEIPFRIVDTEMFKIAASSAMPSLTLRGDQMITDYANGGIVHQGLRVESRGPVSGIDLGKLQPGKPTDGKLKQEILFIAIYIDEKEVLYLDKLNFIYRLNGVDMLAGILNNL